MRCRWWWGTSKKSAIHGARSRNLVGRHFGARGYLVSTVGREEEVIRAYIRQQGREGERMERMKLLR